MAVAENYRVQAEAAARLPKSHPMRFLMLYGKSRVDECSVVKAVSEREARYLIWAFTHPFGLDLMACKETNS